MRWSLNCVWRDVLICSFYRGAMVEHMQWGEWSAVEFRGCRQAVHLANCRNQNSFSPKRSSHRAAHQRVDIFDIERVRVELVRQHDVPNEHRWEGAENRTYSLNNTFRGHLRRKTRVAIPPCRHPITCAIRSSQ